MKTKLRSLFLVASLGLCALAFTAPAQTVTNTTINASGGTDTTVTDSDATNAPAPSITAGLKQIEQAIAALPLANITNYSIDPYATYAPKAPTKFGGGILALYNVSDYVGAGLGVDYLGRFSLVSGDVALKLPTHPLAWTSLSWATNLQMTPFVLGGLGTPLGGASTSVATISDVGDAFEFGHFLGGRFTAGVAWGAWANAGAYSVERYHAFVGWTVGF